MRSREEQGKDTQLFYSEAEAAGLAAFDHLTLNARKRAARRVYAATGRHIPVPSILVPSIIHRHARARCSHRREASTLGDRTSANAPPDPSDAEPPGGYPRAWRAASPAGYTFREHRRRILHLTPAARLAAFWRLPVRVLAETWTALAAEVAGATTRVAA